VAKASTSTLVTVHLLVSGYGHRNWRQCTRGDLLPGKAVNVGEFDSCHRNVTVCHKENDSLLT